MTKKFSNYYERKETATECIKRFVAVAKDGSIIEVVRVQMYVLEQTGLGKQFVNGFLEMLVEMKEISIVNKCITKPKGEVL